MLNFGRNNLGRCCRMAVVLFIYSWCSAGLTTGRTSLRKREILIKSQLHRLTTRTSTIDLERILAKGHVYSRTVGRRKRNIDLPVLPHFCERTKPQIYECFPQVLRPPVYRDWHPVTPDIIPPEEYDNQPASTVSTRYHASSPKPTPRADYYALRNATFQFDVPYAVTTLRLWYQRISSVENRAFEDLKLLKRLNLQNNNISYLGVEAFHGLYQLRELDLSHNRLTSVQNFVFAELRNLKLLSLQYNKLNNIGNSVLCGLESLSTLDLSHNKIEDIGPFALQHFKSTYTVAIRVGYNQLERPHKEWLIRAPKDVIDRACRPVRSPSDASVIQIYPDYNRRMSKIRNAEGMEIKVGELGTDSNSREYSQSEEENIEKAILAPVRMLIGSHNPWNCVCDSKYSLVHFLRLYRSIIASQHTGGSIEDDDEVREYKINSDSGSFPGKEEKISNRTGVGKYFKWYFEMPCDVDDRMDLGRLSSEEYLKIGKSCCSILPNDSRETILKNEHPLGKFCDDGEGNDGELSENHITIIGIVIVFSTPILLTLCPDCNRTVAPGSGSAMVGGGKFGAMSINNNNNKMDRFPWKSNDREPFNNGRFCLVESDEKTPRTFYEEEVV